MKIYIASDHAGLELKGQFIAYLRDELRYEVVDKGPFEYDADDDYPDYVSLVAREISRTSNGAAMGVVIGGSGQAEAMVANRFKGVRAAIFYGGRVPVQAADISGRVSEDEYEIVKISRDHNDANVLSVGARFVTFGEAKEAVRIWLATPFSGHERHVRRINKIDKI